jgi:hypothetical protein
MEFSTSCEYQSPTVPCICSKLIHESSLCGMMPIAALFILFDFVVHNPRHRDTQENLVLLDTAAAHFRLIDTTSHGIIPGNTIAEFAGIARKYATTSIQASSLSRAREPTLSNPSTTSVPLTAPRPMSNDFDFTKLQLAAVSSNSSQVSLRFCHIERKANQASGVAQYAIV